MIAGFTGTRQDTTCEQHAELCRWLRENPPTEFHHGCCVGADAEAVEAVGTFVKECRVVAHPPVNRKLVSAMSEHDSDEVKPPRPYLDRNHDIVDACEVLLACPAGKREVRSGTWATIRYARRVGKPIVIFWPDGSVSREAKA